MLGWGGVGWGLVWMSSIFLDNDNESTPRFILHEQEPGLDDIEDAHFCALTITTRIRRHVEKEYKNQDPKPRRQTNLCMLVYCFRCLCLRACLCMGDRPACAATSQRFHTVLGHRDHDPATVIVTVFARGWRTECRGKLIWLNRLE